MRSRKSAKRADPPSPAPASAGGKRRRQPTPQPQQQQQQQLLSFPGAAAPARQQQGCAPPGPDAAVDAGALRALLAMGFAPGAARGALLAAANNVTLATERLLSDGQ